MDVIDRLIELYETKGTAQYGREAVSQADHALQCAALAESEEADVPMIAAALLHDIGHLVAKARADDTDDRHEDIGWGFLKAQFGPAVSEPVRLHVAAKRYLCSVESGYFDVLSPASVRSLELQGGKFSAAEALAFERRRFSDDAVRLRRWDDCAKTPGVRTRSIRDYARLLRELCP